VNATARGFGDRFDPDASFEAEEPLPLSPDIEDAKPYPLDALGPTLASAARAIMDKVRVPDGIAAQSVLGAAGLAVQPFVDVRLPTSEVRPTCLFMTTVAGSGDRKSSADGFALAGVREAEADLWRRYREDRSNYEIDDTAYREAYNRAKKAKGDVAQAIKDIGPEPSAPPMPIILATEGTIEGLQKLFVEARPSMGLFSDEGGVWLGGFGMNDDNRLKTAAALSEFWDGKPIKRVRAGEGLTLLVGRRLSFHMMIQPEIAEKLLGNGELRGQGLLSRLLVTAPKSLAGTRFHRQLQPETEGDLEAYRRRLYGIMTKPLPMDPETNELHPRAIDMTPEAAAMWWAFADHVERKIGDGMDWDPIRGVVGKLPEQAARLATVIAVFERGRDGVELLDAADLAAGVSLAEFYAEEALRLLDGGGMDPKTKAAEEMRSFLVDKWEAPLIGMRHICQRAPRHLRQAEKVREIMRVLEGTKHVVRLPNGAEIGGQRCSEAWRIMGSGK
jgi:hypothetical protein